MFYKSNQKLYFIMWNYKNIIKYSTVDKRQPYRWWAYCRNCIVRLNKEQMNTILGNFFIKLNLHCIILRYNNISSNNKIKLYNFIDRCLTKLIKKKRKRKVSNI